MSNNSDDKVHVFHRVNKLKRKAGGDPAGGAGFIDPQAMNSAQNAIADKQESYGEEVEDIIIKIEENWKKAKAKSPKDAKKDLERLYHEANHVKDLAATFGYDLMQHFGGSLREFSEKIDVANDAHHVIVQAHIDAMWVAYHENITEEDGAIAEELKKTVAKAIEEHS